MMWTLKGTFPDVLSTLQAPLSKLIYILGVTEGYGDGPRPHPTVVEEQKKPGLNRVNIEVADLYLPTISIYETVIVMSVQSKLKGGVSRQSSSFCFVLRAMNFTSAKKLLVNEKNHSFVRQTGMFTESYI